MKAGLVLLLLLLPVVIMAGCVQETETPQGHETPAIPPELPSLPDTFPMPVPLSPVPDELPAGSVPFIPGRTYHAGDQILMTGTTILSPGNQLLIEISSVAFGPTGKNVDNRISGISAVITVEKGERDSQNRWHYLIDTRDFAPDEYQVLISGITVPKFRESTSFILIS
jgi:hypothetical protein